MNKMTSIQLMQNYTKSRKNMRSCIGWPPINSVKWSLNEKKFPKKIDEANQTIGAMRFENNFMAKKIKKFEVELFQARAQLERTSSAKLDEMLRLQKSAFDRTSLGYDFSSPSISSTNTTVFISPSNNVESENNDVQNVLTSENIDKGKSILGALPKQEKK